MGRNSKRRTRNCMHLQRRVGWKPSTPLASTNQLRRNGHKQDPFLSGQVVSNVISAMIETENEYRKGTADLFVQAAETDRKLVEDLHKIWKEHGTSLQNFHQTMIQITLKFTSFVDQMKTSSPFSEFSRRHDVVASEVFATAITVENFGFEVEHTAIVKEGLLFKQGGFFRNSWKPAWGVLTQSGYFHLFQHSETKGFFSSKPTDSKDIFYRRMTKPETLITVQLRKPRVFVDLPGMTQSASNVSTSKSGPVFEIVEISSSKSLLGGSSSSIPDVGDDKAGTAPLSAVSSGTETRYLLKTNKEEEMVDWVVALRRALEESPTETAPIPLLRHPTELKKEVDEQLRRPSPKEDRPGKRPASRGSEESLDKAIDSPQTPTDPRGRGGEASESPSRSERSRSPKKKVALPSFGNPWV
ncbi:hypothetical protein M427DRAFT_404025 [Gonapodya prolifera JEL478]|uniref:PH domain-containing protein n=1 Tax=Gonapodya prolifera (strain JEL478) TaxID=1344416 RepID=A0A139AUM2_GONPJ|nr:hypothetical protein M427DRAFT_404025 [Gonapodya prolifera JEL478]|eukprot:KXS20185.1 hypothetical protein M427DRAFT_404025 [Gonapodya prolifera JEL478]